ncbi:unnamed protein product, partial [marine sediment metagenome]
MATPAVEELVDEGIGPVDGLVDEGVAPKTEVQPITSLEAWDEFAKQWDIAIDNNISLNDVGKFWPVLKNDTPVIKEPRIGFVETLKKTNVLAKLPFVGSVYKADNIINIIRATRRFNDPSLY